MGESMSDKVRKDIERIRQAKPHEWVPVSQEWMDAGMLVDLEVEPDVK